MGWSGYRYAISREYIHTYNEINKHVDKREIDKRKYIRTLKKNNHEKMHTCIYIENIKIWTK